MVPVSPDVYSVLGWRNPWTEDPASVLFLLALPAMFAILLMMALHARAEHHRRVKLAIAIVPPMMFATWAAVAYAKRHGALADELMVAGGAALAWLTVGILALATRSLNRRFEAGLIIFITTPILFVGAGLVVREAALTWLKHQSSVWAREQHMHEFQVRERALAACSKNYNAEAGRRDAARAVSNGDAQLLYRIVPYQEGASIYVPGIEVIGNDQEGGFPSRDFVRVLGRFGGDRRWYWVDVRETTTVAPWPDPWGWVGMLSGQKSAYAGKCQKAEFDYLDAYNRSIPLTKVPRRPAPAPNPNDVGWGKTLIAVIKEHHR